MPDVFCSACGVSLPEEPTDLPSQKRRPCPNCGARARSFVLRPITGHLAVTLQPVTLSATGVVSAIGSASGSSAAAAYSEATGTPTDVGPDVLLAAQLLDFGDATAEGRLVVGVAAPWWQILRHVEADPGFLFQVPWRKLEELVAGAFERQGWDEVELTPGSGDKGRDVIATRKGVGRVRVITQVKAYKPGHVVTAEEVAAMLGTLLLDHASKAMVATTSQFAPGVGKDARVQAHVPFRIELLDGQQLRDWLREIQGASGGPRPEEVPNTMRDK